MADTDLLRNFPPRAADTGGVAGDPKARARLSSASGPQRAASGSSAWSRSGAVFSRCARIFAIISGSSMLAMIASFPPQRAHALISIPNTPLEPARPTHGDVSGCRWRPALRQFTMIPVIRRQSPTRHPGGFSFGSVRYVTVTVSCRCDAKCATLKTANAMALVDALFCTAK